MQTHAFASGLVPSKGLEWIAPNGQVENVKYRNWMCLLQHFRRVSLKGTESRQEPKGLRGPQSKSYFCGEVTRKKIIHHSSGAGEAGKNKRGAATGTE